MATTESSAEPPARKGLYLLFEGLAETVTDSQALVHVRETRERGLVDFEVWAFACSRETYARSLARRARAASLSGGVVRVFRGLSVRPAVPFSARLNGFLLRSHARRLGSRFEVVHARTDYAAVVASFFPRGAEADLVWDCRGDCVAEFRRHYEGATDPLSRLRCELGTAILEARIRRLRDRADRAIFVTGALREKIHFDGKPSEIVPSTASEQLFFFDPELRERTRSELGYRADDVVLSYSGSLIDYQCFPQCAELFGRLRAKDPFIRFLVLTPEVEAAVGILRRLRIDGAQVLSAPVEEMNRFLNAADFGLLLRRESPVNRVASPTKFAEYCLSGLPVVMTEAVPSAVETATRLESWVRFDFPDRLETLRRRSADERARIASTATQWLSRRANAGAYARIYQPRNGSHRP